MMTDKKEEIDFSKAKNHSSFYTHTCIEIAKKSLNSLKEFH